MKIISRVTYILFINFGFWSLFFLSYLFGSLEVSFFVVLVSSLFTIFLANRYDELLSAYLFLFIFLLVMPFFVVQGENILSRGLLFSNIVLSETHTFVLASVYLTFFSSVSVLTAWYGPSLHINKYNISFVPSKFLYPLLLASFVAIFAFNVLEFRAVIDQGYVALVSGQLTVSKGPILALIELLFLVLASLYFANKRKIAILLLLGYFLTIMIGGQRMPSAMAILLTLFVYSNSFKKFFLLKFLTIFAVGIPTLQFIQALRSFGKDVFLYFDFWGSYYDVFRVAGYSIDTVKAAVSLGRDADVIVTPFDKILQIFSVFSSRVFSIDLAYISTGFGTQFSRFLDYELYDSGTTFASSSLSESFFYLGHLGVCLYGFLVVVFIRYVQFLIHRSSPLDLLLILIFVPRFFTAIRNELFGWLWEGIFFFGVSYIVYLGISALGLVQKRHYSPKGFMKQGLQR